MKKILQLSTISSLCVLAFLQAQAKDYTFIQSSGGNTSWGDGAYWFDNSVDFVEYEDANGNKYYQLNQAALKSLPGANDNVYFTGRVGNSAVTTATFDTMLANGKLNYWLNGTLALDENGKVDVANSKFVQLNNVERLMQAFHNGSRTINVKNLDISIDKDYVFADRTSASGANNTESFLFHFIGNTAAKNNVTVAETFSVSGGKNVLFNINFKDADSAESWNFGRLDVNFDSTSTLGRTLVFGNDSICTTLAHSSAYAKNATIGSIIIGATAQTDGTYQANTLAASEISASSNVFFGGEASTATSRNKINNLVLGSINNAGNITINYVENVTVAKNAVWENTGYVDLKNTTVSLGNTNNKGSINIENSAVSMQEGTWINQSFTTGEGDSAVTQTGTTIAKGSAVLDNFNVNGGTLAIASANPVLKDVTLKGGALLEFYKQGGEGESAYVNTNLNLSGKLVLDNANLMTSRYSDGTGASTSINSCLVEMDANSSIDATTNKFWINFFADISMLKVRMASTGYDVNMQGSYLFKGNGKYEVFADDTSQHRTLPQVYISGKNVNINKIEFDGGFFYGNDKSVAFTTVDYGNWINGGKTISINDFKLRGDTSFTKQYFQIKAGDSVNITNFNMLGGDTAEDARYGTELRLNSNKKEASKISNLTFSGYMKNGATSQIETFSTPKLTIDNFFADVGFNFNQGVVNAEAAYTGSTFDFGNFTVKFAEGKSNTNATLGKINNIEMDNFTADNGRTTDASITVFANETWKVTGDTKIGTDSTSKITVNAVTNTYEIVNKVVVDNQGTYTFNNVELGSLGTFNVGGWAKNEGDSNLIMNNLKMTSGSLISMAHNNAGGADAENRTNYLATIATLSGNGGTIQTYNKFINATISLGTSGTETSTFNGSIIDSANSVTNIVKTGTNTQILDGGNSFKGFVTVNEGTLLISAENQISEVNVKGGNFGAAGSVQIGALNYTSGKIVFDVLQMNVVGVDGDFTGTLSADSFAFSNISDGALLTLFNFTNGVLSDNLNALLSSVDNGKYEYTDLLSNEKYYATFTENSGSFNVTFSYIPEPSTYAVFAGLLALGLAIYRRRK